MHCAVLSQHTVSFTHSLPRCVTLYMLAPILILRSAAQHISAWPLHTPIPGWPQDKDKAASYLMAKESSIPLQGVILSLAFSCTQDVLPLLVVGSTCPLCQIIPHCWVVTFRLFSPLTLRILQNWWLETCLSKGRKEKVTFFFLFSPTDTQQNNRNEGGKQVSIGEYLALWADMSHLVRGWEESPWRWEQAGCEMVIFPPRRYQIPELGMLPSFLNQQIVSTGWISRKRRNWSCC